MYLIQYYNVEFNSLIAEEVVGSSAEVPQKDCEIHLGDKSKYGYKIKHIDYFINQVGKYSSFAKVHLDEII